MRCASTGGTRQDSNVLALWTCGVGGDLARVPEEHKASVRLGSGPQTLMMSHHRVEYSDSLGHVKLVVMVSLKTN